MNKILVCFVVAIISGCAGTKSSSSDFQGYSYYNIPKQIRYSFSLKNSTGMLLKSPQFWTYLPVPITAHQKLERITSNLPYRVQQDALGNEMIHFDLQDIPPYGTRIVSISVDMMMSELAAPTKEVGNMQRFLASEPHIEVDDKQVSQLAMQLKSNSDSETAQRDYEWVANNIQSENFIPEDRGALYALNTRHGDCTEFAYLLTALFRAQKIPARAMGGYVFSGNGVVKALDYHNWTEFYSDGVWQIADAQLRSFTSRQLDYVAMRIIATGASSEVSAQRFSYAGEGLKIEMN